MILAHIQIIALVASVGYLVLIVRALRTSRMTVRQSLGWLSSAGLFILISTCPGLLMLAGRAFGFVVASNALFLVWSITLTVLLFYQSTASSKQSEEIRAMAQALAILRVETERRLSGVERELPTASEPRVAIPGKDGNA